MVVRSEDADEKEEDNDLKTSWGRFTVKHSAWILFIYYFIVPLGFLP